MPQRKKISLKDIQSDILRELVKESDFYTKETAYVFEKLFDIKKISKMKKVFKGKLDALSSLIKIVIEQGGVLKKLDIKSNDVILIWKTDQGAKKEMSFKKWAKIEIDDLYPYLKPKYQKVVRIKRAVDMFAEKSGKRISEKDIDDILTDPTNLYVDRLLKFVSQMHEMDTGLLGFNKRLLPVFVDKKGMYKDEKYSYFVTNIAFGWKRFVYPFLKKIEGEGFSWGLISKAVRSYSKIIQEIFAEVSRGEIGWRQEMIFKNELLRIQGMKKDNGSYEYEKTPEAEIDLDNFDLEELQDLSEDYKKKEEEKKFYYPIESVNADKFQKATAIFRDLSEKQVAELEKEAWDFISDLNEKNSELRDLLKYTPEWLDMVEGMLKKGEKDLDKVYRNPEIKGVMDGMEKNLKDFRNKLKTEEEKKQFDALEKLYVDAYTFCLIAKILKYKSF